MGAALNRVVLVNERVPRRSVALSATLRQLAWLIEIVERLERSASRKKPVRRSATTPSCAGLAPRERGESRYSAGMVRSLFLFRERLRAWLAQRDLVLLTSALLLVALVWAFVEIADEVAEGETKDVDDQILMA